MQQNIAMYSYLWFLIAALGEIAGCYTLWMWLRVKVSGMAAPGGFSSLVLFVALTRIDSAIAGRAFAACDGIYILCSLIWMLQLKEQNPIWDIFGTLFCLLGSAFILLSHCGHRADEASSSSCSLD